MKKHVKKRFMLPVLAFVCAVAIAACCYIMQTFNAFAEADSDFAIAEQNYSEYEFEPNPAYESVTARIHLSTNETFKGALVENFDFTEADRYIAWSGEKYLTFKGATRLYFNFMPSHLEDNSTDVIIGAYNETEFKFIDPICFVTLNNSFYQYAGLTCNFTWFNNTADITINVVPSYYIGFNANGGEFLDDSSIQWVAQGEYNSLTVPLYNPEREGYEFAGWYTQPWGGQRVVEYSQVPSWGEIFVLYAHWVKDNERLNIHIGSPDFSPFSYKLIDYDTSEVIDSGISWFYDVPSNLDGDDYRPLASDYSTYYFYHCIDTEINDDILYVEWEYDSNPYALYICPLEGQRINSVSLNGGVIPYDYDGDMYLYGLSSFNNFELNTSWETPGYVSVASDNGQMFECEVDYYDDAWQDPINLDNTYKFVSDYVPIYVSADEYVYYTYGGMNREYLNATAEDTEAPGNGFTIIVRNYKKEICREYKFRDNLTSLFDWLNFNSYILSVDADGQPLPNSNYVYSLDNGYHSFVLNMSGEKPVPPDPPTPPDPPVPPDPPTPPEPGPTPEPVNPDVPGGGGSAQTGDSMPLVPIAALAVIAALGCGLAIRKEYF